MRLCLPSQVSKTGPNHLLRAPGASRAEGGGVGRTGATAAQPEARALPGPVRPKVKPWCRRMRFHSQAASLKPMGLSHLLSLQTSDVNVLVLKKKKKKSRVEETRCWDWQRGQSPGPPRAQAGPAAPLPAPEKSQGPFCVCVFFGGGADLSRALGASRR